MKYLFLLYLSLFFPVAIAYAQQLPNTTEVNTPWQQNEYNQQEKTQQIRETRLKENLKSTPTPPKQSTVSTDTPVQEECLPVKDLYIKGLRLLTRSQRTTIYENYPTDCFTTTKLNKLVNIISQQFLESGYIRVTLTQQTKGEQLIWQVNVATITKIENKTSLKTITLLPKAKNHPLNIKDLDQALDQANRLKGRTVTTDVYPYKDNTVTISLVEEKRKNVYGNIGIDNRGSDSTGRKQLRANIVADNPLGIADQFSLYANSTLEGSQRYSRGATAFYSVPYGYWTFSGSAGIYTYKTQAQLTNSTAELTGQTKRITARAERVFSRGSHHISSAYGTVDTTSVESKLLGTRIEVQSPDIDAFTIGINHTHIFNQSLLNIDAAIRQGSNTLQLDEGKETTSFLKANAHFHWEQYVPIKGHNVRFRHQLGAQYSSDDLPSVEEISITGAYAVHGFRNNNISGDSGFYLRETVTTGMNIAGHQLQPYLGIGIGRAWSKDIPTKSAIGGILGLSLPLNDWHFDFSITKGKRFVRNDKHTTLPTEAYLQIQRQF